MPVLKQAVQSPVDPWAVHERISTSDARYALASTLMPVQGSSYIDYRSGVMASGDGGDTHMAARVAPAGGMKVTVEPANIVINTENSGPYMGALYERTTLTLAPASTTSNRVDVVLARIHDDQNPAIGSTVGERKMTVELWTGDEITGDPTTPVIPVAAGWHPLAYITVMANTSALTEAMIRDKRGPGLVTRGGMRALYGEDALVSSSEFATPGAYPGDQRWVHGVTFPHQVYYGSGAGWRGVQNGLNYRAQSRFTGSGIQWFKDVGVHHEICAVDIPDPGTPYMVYPSARIEAWYGRAVRADFYIRLGTDNGARMTWVSGDCRWNHGADKHLITNVAPMMYGPISGSTRVVLTGAAWEQENGNYGWGLDRNEPQDTELNVMIYPSVVSPAE